MSLFSLIFFPNSWWIDSSATTHVINSLQGLLFVMTKKKGERNHKIVDGKEIEVEDIECCPLALEDDYTLLLNNVLYASLRRN